MKNVFIFGTENTQGGNGACLSKDAWASIKERKQLKARIAATPVARRKELWSAYCMKMREVYRNVRRDKRKYINALVTEAEDASS